MTALRQINSIREEPARRVPVDVRRAFLEPFPDFTRFSCAFFGESEVPPSAKVTPPQARNPEQPADSTPVQPPTKRRRKWFASATDIANYLCSAKPTFEQYRKIETLLFKYPNTVVSISQLIRRPSDNNNIIITVIGMIKDS